MHRPHPDAHSAQVDCAIITVSDTRTVETDRSGQLLQQLLRDAGHFISSYEIVPDEPERITTHIQTLCQSIHLDAVILNGGTGIAPRDTTYDAIARLLDKELPGFGELFRWLSYQEIGSRAIASRAIAGVCQTKLIFSLPGSTNAVQMATEKLILPELGHLTEQIKGATSR